ncbi:MAG: hypothetical protein UZ20_WS6002000446 [candidate division WS6 bacterium OLB21]|uniref:Uncharacterized protein n=1 Tax=candidate division WS6 bacterium OLB21 TaxID=1617427 RepID=A0A136KJN9_9BACT|nr:MAG: hypothetical protein UZ20_WS6002000446 [candidate division WS6 bacterium OLB21]
MTEQEKYSRLILANTQGVGPTFFKKVLNDYQSINSFLQDNSSTLYKKSQTQARYRKECVFRN